MNSKFFLRKGLRERCADEVVEKRSQFAGPRLLGLPSQGQACFASHNDGKERAQGETPPDVVASGAIV